jgi:RimJ/RimL family protein N-acetyltransferase
MIINTTRLRLRDWREEDRDPFAAMNADPEVARYLGGPQSRAASNARLDDYVRAYEQHGFTRWVVEHRAGGFLGCVGVMPSRDGHPLGPHHEIGWRLARDGWGRGYATEAAAGALQDAFVRVRLTEILAYTTAENTRSRAVIERLGMQRDSSRDFHMQVGDIAWQGLVWVSVPT